MHIYSGMAGFDLSGSISSFFLGWVVITMTYPCGVYAFLNHERGAMFFSSICVCGLFVAFLALAAVNSYLVFSTLDPVVFTPNCTQVYPFLDSCRLVAEPFGVAVLSFPLLILFSLFCCMATYNICNLYLCDPNRSCRW